MKMKGLKVVREDIKQTIKAKVGKRQYQQNRMFNNNEGRFYQRLNKEVHNQKNEIPDAREAKSYWESIWSESKEHNRRAEWLKDVQNTLSDNQCKGNEELRLQWENRER